MMVAASYSVVVVDYKPFIYLHKSEYISLITIHSIEYSYILIISLFLIDIDYSVAVGLPFNHFMIH